MICQIVCTNTCFNSQHQSSQTLAENTQNNLPTKSELNQKIRALRRRVSSQDTQAPVEFISGYTNSETALHIYT